MSQSSPFWHVKFYISWLPDLPPLLTLLHVNFSNNIELVLQGFFNFFPFAFLILVQITFKHQNHDYNVSKHIWPHFGSEWIGLQDIYKWSYSFIECNECQQVLTQILRPHQRMSAVNCCKILSSRQCASTRGWTYVVFCISIHRIFKNTLTSVWSPMIHKYS